MSFDAVEYLNSLVSSQGTELEDITSAYELTMDWRIEYEERAAVLEYDGGLSRNEAEAHALIEIKHRMQLWRKDSVW